MGLTGGVGEVGEKLHGVERNSVMGSVGARDGRSGGSAKSSGRRRRFAAAAAVRWSGATASGSGSTSGGRGRWLRGLLGTRKGGGGGSAAS